MPHGHNIGTCLHCGTQFTCGNAILDVCPGCAAGGHSGALLNACPACATATRMRRARIDAVLSEAATAEERAKRERTRAAIAESKAARERPSEVLRWIAEALEGWEPGIDADGNFTLEDINECE
jgi:hypothetical protein